jgi:hypothetical protein
MLIPFFKNEPLASMNIAFASPLPFLTDTALILAFDWLAVLFSDRDAKNLGKRFGI